jgi:hypothetical protein
LLGLQVNGLGRVKFTEVNRFVDVGRRFAPLLAAFEDLPSGQLEQPVAHPLGGLAQELRAACCAWFVPGREGRFRGNHGLVGVAASGQSERADDFRFHRRICRFALVERIDLMAANDHGIVLPELLTNCGQGI